MLAIHGGKPIREDYLTYGQQWISDEDIENVLKTLKSPFLTQGPKIAEFEEKIANYVGAKYAVAFCNGTAALHGACFAAGISTGDEVITSPITFVATANAVLYMGGKPVFADIDDNTYNISVSEIERLINSKTKAIIGIDFSGQPVAIDQIRKLANKHNLTFIEDGAHSLGATYKGEKVGSQADMTMFSFHPVKPITTGEGGIIVTNSEDFAKKLRLFRSHGVTNDRSQLIEDHGPWYYEMQELGMNYRMTDIQAALGISQLNHLDQFIERRREWAKLYTESFSQMKGVIPPYEAQESNSGWHLYVLRLNLDCFSVTRKEIFDALRAENIGVHVHYIPVYYQPYYKKLGYGMGICPVAEKWYDEVITLPLYPKMELGDVHSVIKAVEKVLNYFYK